LDLNRRDQVRLRASARLLQCLWLRDHDIPTAASTAPVSTSSDTVNGTDRNSYTPATSFGSILSAEAANAGRNFLSPAVHRLALQEWLLCEDGACIDEERLFGKRLAPNHSWRHRIKTLGRRNGLAGDILDAMTGHGRKTVADTYGEFPPEAMLRELRKIPVLELRE
jgi:hypothetical protein